MDKPRVKPLEWDGRKTTGVMFQYRVHIGYGLMDGIYALTLSGSTIGEYGSIEAAKAAAQADYEARILAALEPVTVQEAARVLMQNKVARDTAFNAFWDVSQKHSLEATNRAGARYSITGNVVNEMWYAALIALADTGEDG